MQKLARHFVPVSDEVYTLTHGIEWNKNDRASQFFNEFGKQVPDDVWNASDSTHQGIYLMTPDGDYLGATFARHDVEETVKLLKNGLKKWRRIARKRDYNPKKLKPIPQRDTTYSRNGAERSSPTGGRLDGEAALVLMVHSRDLPSHEPADQYKQYKNIWNRQWLELSKQEVQSLIPNQRGRYRVPTSLVRTIGRHSFIDNVRGQTKDWKPEHIQEAKLVAEPQKMTNGTVRIKYSGAFSANAGSRSIDVDLFGTVLWNPDNQAVKRIELVAAGIRSGHTKFNFRKGEGPSPIGFTLTLESQYDR